MKNDENGPRREGVMGILRKRRENHTLFKSGAKSRLNLQNERGKEKPLCKPDKGHPRCYAQKFQKEYQYVAKYLKLSLAKEPFQTLPSLYRRIRIEDISIFRNNHVTISMLFRPLCSVTFALRYNFALDCIMGENEDVALILLTEVFALEALCH